MAQLPISLQLYTVRDLTAKDFGGTMRDVAQIGYRYVELAGYGNLKTAAEAKKALDDAGLKASGMHAPIDVLEKDPSKSFDEADVLGLKNIICPWIPEERRKDAAAWRTIAGILNRAGQAAVDRGFDFAYHNHSFEFQKFDGKYALDILWEHTDHKLVKSELDVYWVQHGGVDPAAYIRQLGGRCILLHLKDMAAGPDKRFAPVGTGILDFKAICDEATKAGVKFGVVEQDNCYDTPPLESIRISLENLKKLGVA
jgi:sugar phosphate isomerase/epimerase